MADSRTATHWRLRLSGYLLPYARLLTAITLVLMALPLADSFFSWGVLNLSGRRATGLALGIGLLWFIVTAPELHQTGRAPPPGDVGK